ncbi:MAG TPA: hypothetical protein VKX49_17850 [Bryobacteraceae bacterium]|nr:hypothetical protein [Bryobacteraceae bacterium]
MSRPRLLIPLSIQFSVRYLLRTGLLQRISDFAHPIVLLGWEDEALRDELMELGAEVYPLIQARRSVQYERVRSLLSIAYKKRLNSVSEPIWERRADAHRSFAAGVRRRARKQVVRAFFAIPGTEEWLLEKERAMLASHTNFSEFQRQIAALQPDGALTLTPYLPSEEMAMRACVAAETSVCASMLSFDNITSRGWIPVSFDQYLVWNRYDVAALLRGYPEIAPEMVHIVGAPQFDFYWDPKYRWPEQRWRQHIGLPANGPVILFGGGHYFCAPHEPNLLLQLDQAIEDGGLPSDTTILFRCHPVDPIGRWLPALSRTKHVVRDDPWARGAVLGQTNLRVSDIEKLASTLHHCAVHVNVASTMAIDGSIFDRPQVGPAYDDSPARKFDRIAREVYLQEHYLPITHAGGLEIARSRAELVAAVRDGLENPGRLAAGRKQIVKEICTYSDGRCTERVAAEVRFFLNPMRVDKPVTVEMGRGE